MDLLVDKLRLKFEGEPIKDNPLEVESFISGLGARIDKLSTVQQNIKNSSLKNRSNEESKNKLIYDENSTIQKSKKNDIEDILDYCEGIFYNFPQFTPEIEEFDI